MSRNERSDERSESLNAEVPVVVSIESQNAETDQSVHQSREVTSTQAAKELLVFSLPLIARSMTLIAAGVTLPIFISKYNESLLAAYSEIGSAEAALMAIYVSGAYSVPPVVGMLVRLNEDASKIIADAKKAIEEYRALDKNESNSTANNIRKLLAAGVEISKEEYAKNKTIQKIKDALFTFIFAIRDNQPDKIQSALKKLNDIQSDTQAEQENILVLNDILSGIQAYDTASEDEKKAVATIILAQRKLDESVKSINLFQVILSNWKDKPKEEKKLYSWTEESLQQFSTTITHVSDNLERLPSKIGMVFRQSMIYATGLGLVAAAGGFLMPELFQLLRQPQAVVDATRGYFRFAGAGYFLDTIYRMQLRYMIGQGIRKTALYGEILDVAAQLLLSYVFLFHVSMGLEGIALAMSLAKISTLIAHTTFILLSKTQKNYQLTSMTDKFIQPALLKKLVVAGLPLSVESFIDTIRMMVVTTFCGLKGTRGLTAMQASGLYATVDGFPMGALFQAVNAKVGEHQETFNSRNVVTYGNIGIALLMLIALATLPIALFLPQYIAKLLIDPSKERDDYLMAITFLRIEGVSTLIMSVLFALQANLSGLMDNAFTMKTTIATGLMLNIALASTATFVLKKDETYIYGSQVMGFFLAACVLSGRWMQHSKKYHAPIDQVSQSENRETRSYTGRLLNWLGFDNKSRDGEQAPLLQANPAIN